MKKFVTLAVLAAAAHSSAIAAADVGVSIGFSQPGVYGRIDIGRFPAPQVVVAQPVLVAPAPRAVQVEPVYLWVPYGHRKNWRAHCSRYNACGAPVYFVHHGWYDQHVRRGRDDHARRDDRDRGHDRYDGRRGHDDKPGRGRGRGKGRDD